MKARIRKYWSTNHHNWRYRAEVKWFWWWSNEGDFAYYSQAEDVIKELRNDLWHMHTSEVVWEGEV